MTRAWLLLSALIAALPAASQTVSDCHGLQHHGKLAEAQNCFLRLAGSTNPYFRAEGLWGLERYQEANDAFRAAAKEFPKNAEYRVRWGRLFLERFNKDEARGLFQEALGIDKTNAEAQLGLALVAEDFSPRATELAKHAAEQDPKLVEAREVLAYLALEDNDPKLANEEADRALKISDEALDAMAIHATVDWITDKAATPHVENAWMDRILKINPVYGEAYSTAGHFFFINRRYPEAIMFYRKALDLNPRLWEARAQLGVNLMRVGQEQEARQQLEQCYNANYKSYEVVNSLRLLDKYSSFVTFKTDNTIVLVDKKEADLLHPYVESELKRAIATYEKKYQMKLNAPVQVEVYPDHEDFAVRTMGMPGLPALGVTFGHVVGMDSPSGRPPGSFHWAATMWHELSHVFVLQATDSRVPRWFTEGLAVYEESAASPSPADHWGDPLDPVDIEALKNKKLVPVAELENTFIRPSYPSQVNVSYYQGGEICTFIVEKWGYSKILDMIHGFARLETTPEVFQNVFGISTEEFDKQFFAWLDAHTKNTVDHFDDWRKQLKEISEDLRAKKYDDVIREGTAIRDWYTDYVEPGSVYEFLADAYQAKGDKAAAQKELEKYNEVGGRSPLLVERLATLEDEAGEHQKAAATLDRLNYIYPESQELHKRLGDLWLAQDNTQGAIREYRAFLALKPLDQATAHYQLAAAYHKANRVNEARDEVLLSLEAAPGFKPAQKLLLEISNK